MDLHNGVYVHIPAPKVDCEAGWAGVISPALPGRLPEEVTSEMLANVFTFHR